jgi:hypothetical protein
MLAESPLIPPEPRRTWTEVHEPGDTLRVEIIDRREIEKVDKDGNPQTLVAITGVDADGVEWDVPLFRMDLRKAIPEAHKGVEIAFTYWGMQGQRYVYTHKARDRSEQLALTPRVPMEEAPPPGDEDYMGDGA